MSRYENLKQANSIFKDIESNKKDYLIIHYSCESFYNKYDGKSPRITSIAVKYLESGNSELFSIHKVAEINHIDFDSITENYDELEREMLNNFFDFVQLHIKYKWIHWNMRDPNYGFKAIEHRYRVLTSEKSNSLDTINDTNTFNLASLFIQKYSSKYANNPRIENLATLNHIEPKDFLKGAEEDIAFKNKDYILLSMSTLSKVDLFSNFLNREFNGTLKTNIKSSELYGTTIKGVYLYFKSTKLGKMVISFFTLILGAIIQEFVIRKIFLHN